MNRTYLPLLVALAITGSIHAAEAAIDGSQSVDVPDPIGLGERLALIDWFHEHQVEFPADGELPALRVLYMHAAHPELFADVREEQQAREEISAALWTKHGVNADPNKTVAQLREELKKLDGNLATKHAKQREEQLAAGGGPDRGNAADAGGKNESNAGATTPVAPAAKAPSAPAQIPTVDDDNRRYWANYSTAPMSTKDNVTLWLYFLQGDTTKYYIIAHNRRPSPCTVEFSIGDERYSLDFNNGKIAVPVSVPAASFAPAASITINKVK